MPAFDTQEGKHRKVSSVFLSAFQDDVTNLTNDCVLQIRGTPCLWVAELVEKNRHWRSSSDSASTFPKKQIQPSPKIGIASCSLQTFTNTLHTSTRDGTTLAAEVVCHALPHYVVH